MNAWTGTTATTATTATKPACQRCGHREHDLTSFRGMRWCGLCLVIAKVRALIG